MIIKKFEDSEKRRIERIIARHPHIHKKLENVIISPLKQTGRHRINSKGGKLSYVYATTETYDKRPSKYTHKDNKYLKTYLYLNKEAMHRHPGELEETILHESCHCAQHKRDIESGAIHKPHKMADSIKAEREAINFASRRPTLLNPWRVIHNARSSVNLQQLKESEEKYHSDKRKRVMWGF